MTADELLDEALKISNENAGADVERPTRYIASETGKQFLGTEPRQGSGSKQAISPGGNPGDGESAEDFLAQNFPGEAGSPAVWTAGQGSGADTADAFIDARLEGVAGNAADDDEELSFLEKMRLRWRMGREQAVDDQMAYRAMTGEVPWESVKSELEPSEDRSKAQGKAWYSEGLLGATEMLPAMVDSLMDGWQLGVGGALAAGGAALVGGQLGPQVAFPEEVITVPGAALGGFAVGQAAGGMQYWYRQGSGSLYHELRKEGVPHPAAQAVAAGFGVPYAAIELSQVAKLVPGLKQSAARAVAGAVKDRLVSLAKEKGVEYVEQIGQETGQELLTIGAEALAGWASGVKAPEDKRGAWERIASTIKSTAASVPFLMLPRTVGQTAGILASNPKPETATSKVAEPVNDSPSLPAEGVLAMVEGQDSGDARFAPPKANQSPATNAAMPAVSEAAQSSKVATKAGVVIDPAKVDSESGLSGAGEATGNVDTEGNGASRKELFTAEQATLPRRIEWLRPEGKGNVSPGKIRKYLKRALDVSIRRGVRVSHGAQSALGLYRVKEESIRMKAMNDLPTLFHEVGHYLHFMMFPQAGDRSRASDFASVFDSELIPLGAATSLPSYSKSTVRKEGVAEWFRTWAADPAAARAAAPHFTAHFESTLSNDFPELQKILGELQKQVGLYIAQPAKAKAMGMIEWDPTDADQRGPVGRFAEWWRGQYTAWVNELAPIERAAKRLVEFGLPEARAKEVVARAENFKGGWLSKAHYDMEHAQTDLNGKEIGPSLRAILSEAADQRELATYAALKRAEEKARQGFRTGFEDTMKSPDYPAMMAEWAARYEATRKKLVAYTENQMLLLEQSGLISNAQRVAMKAANADYVPFHRVMDSVLPSGTRKGRGFVNTGQGVSKFAGSDLEISNPLEAIAKNGMIFRELAERNRVGALFVQAVSATQGGGRIGEAILRPMKPVQVTHEEVENKLVQSGLLKKGAKLPAAARDLGFTIFRAAQGANAREGVFTIWQDGKPVVFQVEDRELLRALTLMDSADAEVFSKLPFLKLFSGATSVLRKGATLTPEFLIRNPFRDQIIAGVYSRFGFVPFWDGFRGVLHMLGKDDVYRAWIKSGGKYAGLYDVDVGDPAAALREASRGDRRVIEQVAYLANPLNVLKHLQAASELLEGATRVSEFRRAKAAGLSDVDAANAARDVTLNFARGGYRGTIMNKLVAFFNASVQDLDKMGRTFRERPVATTAKAIAMISIPSAWVWYLGKDDEEIQNLPEWRKSFFWNVKIPGGLGGEDFILSVPKPFLLGALFGTSVEKGLDLAYRRDPNAVNKWFSAVIQNSLVRADLMVPTALKPLVEGLTNYSFFKDAPLENQAQRALSPGMRVDSNSSHVAREVGGRLGISPIMIDNTIRGYLGGLGKYGTDAIDWFMLSVRSADTPLPPAKDPQELPLLRALMVPPDEPSEFVGRFYRAMDNAETRLRDFKKYGERMETAEQAAFWKRNRNEIAFYSAGLGERTLMSELRAVRTRLTEINRAMVQVRDSPKLSPGAKRDALKALSKQRDAIAEAAFLRLVHPTDKKKAY